MSRAPTRTDYAVLGLRPGASDEAIRDAYRRLAKIHHPDRNPGDPHALATFARLSESYAALRARPRSGTLTGGTPLSAAASRRAASPRGQAPARVAVADLPIGGSAWVAADAVLVAPGRVAALDPAATGSAFPSADQVIRVERRGDGHHVFMPPQPSARWPLSAAADTEGLAVAALWVGDRQDQEPGHAAAARMPLRLMTGTVGELALRQRRLGGRRGARGRPRGRLDAGPGRSPSAARPTRRAPSGSAATAPATTSTATCRPRRGSRPRSGRGTSASRCSTAELGGIHVASPAAAAHRVAEPQLTWGRSRLPRRRGPA